MKILQKKNKSQQRKDSLTDQDYAKLGREMESILVTDYIQSLHSTPRQIWSSLLRGVFGGLGGILGATVGVAVLLFLLQSLGSHLPLVGPYFKHISQSIQSGVHRK